MRHLTGAVLLVCACLPSAAGEADVKQRAKASAQEMADAFTRQDYEKLVGYTNPEVVKLLGGRDKAAAAVKTALAQLKAKGLVVRSYKIQDATVAGEGARRFAVVTSVLVLDGPGKRVTSPTFLVGASEDSGKTWTFVDGAQANERTIPQFIPDFPKGLKLPARQKPKVEDIDG
jgi:hypothetical protein